MNFRRRHSRASAEVNTSSLNDIMFFLLLFFLITSTVTNPNVIKLLLPRSDSGQSVSKKTITLSITKDLQYYVEKKPVSLEAMTSVLQTYQKSAQELTIVMYVDRTVAIEEVVKVMDIANKLRIKMVLATDKK